MSSSTTKLIIVHRGTLKTNIHQKTKVAEKYTWHSTYVNNKSDFSNMVFTIVEWESPRYLVIDEINSIILL